MKTLTRVLNERKAQHKPLIVPYIMAGDGGLDTLPETISFLEENGVAAIEIGIPFSDPVADGPIIQQAGLRALNEQISLRDIVKTLQHTQSNVPLVMMTYFNPIFQIGVPTFIESLRGTNVKGLIIPDLPYEHQDLLTPYLDDADIALVPLVSLTSSKQRIEQIVKDAEGFIYAVTVNGTTGTRQTFGENIGSHLQNLKAQTDIPVLAGFGVSKVEHVEQFMQVADGVVIGSKIVSLLHEAKHAELADFLTKVSEV
ncbi:MULTISPECIES: tryptophan synthase subunit alpha [Listeria]|uniref:tryptophan synthase subunit alpha n=1 Tax=Listeria TaxID=1637 RepID=UPI000B591DD6|nr:MULTISPECIES: tryptophan synthase subunit alpha [Listeria]